ncbi:MAG: MG2 domain-containing protein [Bacteroidia bacterium]|nr:MG2 domain-containing protein [Bacteroidia bacterium]MDW8159537.1 MG2 domain-containing protein [Bacteroidia bacterium]
MVRLLSHLIVLFLAWFFLTTCGLQRTAIRKTNFEEEIDLFQNLTFDFNRPMVSTAELGKWDTTPYLHFKPQVPGRFQWASPTKLIFSPAYGFEASTLYEAQVNSAAFKRIEPKYPIEEQIFTFHTPYLQPLAVYPFWYEENNTFRVGAKIVFNYLVEPFRLQPLVTLQLGKDRYKSVALSQSSAKAIDLVFPNVTLSGEESVMLNFVIAAGLECKGSNFRTPEPFHFSLPLEVSRRVVIYEAIVEPTENGEMQINVIASQALREDSKNIQLLEKPYSAYYYYYDSTFVPINIHPTPTGALITVSLQPNLDYELLIRKGTQGIIGEVAELFSVPIQAGPALPSITFTDPNAKVLSSQGSRSISIKISGVDEFNVRIAKIYENNLLQFLKRGLTWGYYWDNITYRSFEYVEWDIEGLGDVVYEKVYHLSDLPKVANSQERILEIDELEKNKQYRGIYIIQVVAKDQYWIRATKELVLSDIGLIAHKGKTKLWISAQSLLTALPIPGVKIQLISTNNQIIGSATTKADGIAIMPLPDSATTGFHPALITASFERELSYLDLTKNRVETSRFPVEGKFLVHPEYDAYIYGDRTIYRPGEKVNINILCRTHQRQTPVHLPLELKVYAPGSKLLQQLKFQLNSEGAYCLEFELPSTAITGQYNMELSTPSGKLLQTYSILVEEFTPDKIKLNVNLGKKQYNVGDKVEAKIQADYFWGGAASGTKVEAELQIVQQPLVSKSYSNYHFRLEKSFPSSPIQTQTFTDEQGNATLHWNLDPSLKNQGLLQGKIYTTLFDESGNFVSQFQTFDIFSQEYFLGIRKTDYYFSTGKNIPFSLVAVNGYGERYSYTAWANIKILYYEWENALERVEGNLQYIAKAKTKVLQEKLVALQKGEGVIEFNPIMPGEYELRLYVPGAENYVSYKFYAYGFSTFATASFALQKEGNIEMVANKRSYRVGEVANILIKAPFDGILKVCLATEEILDIRTLEVKNNVAEFRVSIASQHLPNVYVLATLIRPVEVQAAYPLIVANGIISLKVEDPLLKLPVTIIAPKTSRSQCQITVQVQTEPGAEVTLACVDEGILQLIGLEPPSAYNYFYAKKALQVDSYHFYGLLLPELGKKRLKSTGGSSMSESSLARRQNPFGNYKKPIAFWFPAQKANANGLVTFAFTLPQFAGSLRCMAIAYRGQKMGDASHSITVVDPLVLNLNSPEFLSPADTLVLSVICQNTLNTAAQYAIQIKVSSPLKLIGNSRQYIHLQPKGRQPLTFQLVAQSVGKGNIEVLATGNNTNFRVEAPISIRPPYPLTYETGSGYIAAGEKLNLSFSTSWMLSDYQLVVSPSPLAQGYSFLRSLIRYPYGCLEQTVAMAFPQIYCLQGKENSLIDASLARKNVSAAINKILALQLSDGSLAFWQGGEAASPWAQVFAAHFLTEAKKAGFYVPEVALDKLLRYLESYASQMPEVKIEKTENGKNGGKYTYLSRASVYALWVLAENGKKPLSLLTRYREKRNFLRPESQVVLACTYGLLGDKKSFQALLPKPIVFTTVKREWGQDFASPLRERSFVYYVLVSVEPFNSQYLQAVRQLAKNLQQEKFLNTQEAVFGFLAILKLANQEAINTQAQAQIITGNKTYSYSGKELKLSAAQLGDKAQIVTAGKGGIYYYWEKSGIPSQQEPLAALKEEKGIRIERQYFNKNGQIIKGNQFVQNELVIVQLKVQTILAQSIDNVVITDLIPAGFQLENPRVRLSSSLNWLVENQKIQHRDFRADRVHFFLSTLENTAEVYYAMRATQSGIFTQGAASVEAMYDPAFYSQTSINKVKITTYSPKAL